MISFEYLRSSRELPDPLKILCLRKIIDGPTNLKRFVLPSELSELIATAFRDHALANRYPSSVCSEFYRQFDHRYMPLKSIDFSGLPIDHCLLIDFLKEYQDQIEGINIAQCPDLKNINLRKFNSLLKKNKKTHKSLTIADSFSERLGRCEEGLFDNDVQLKKLVLHQLHPGKGPYHEFTISHQLSTGYLTPTMSHSLKYLDLSFCSIGKGSALMQLQSLEILILYNCNMFHEEIIPTICHLKKLRVLDLSRSTNDDERDPQPEIPDLLEMIVNRLPGLTRLDISGTSLVCGKDRHIPALEGRANRPFEFLGLFQTNNDAAYRTCLPAQVVAGEASESQVLNACEAYIDRPPLLSKALNELYNLYKTITPSETFDNVDRALDVVLPILSKHLNDEQVTIFTTAALWCIVKINVTSNNLTDSTVRRAITSRLLDVMHYHRTSRVILINGSLTLLFLPDIICEHSRVASISLQMCRNSDPRTQGFGTTLLNTLACQVGGDQKVFIGRLNAVETMIGIIRSKIANGMCDEVLEAAWSTLWNITDETPVNCQRFLESSGLTAFEECMDRFINNKEVQRNIMGLLGNVAECKDLRKSFLRESYIKRFYYLLTSNIDGIECSYNACGIFAHLISDGEDVWNQYLSSSTETSREKILEGMRNAISSWPINSRRNINYRSFEPIVRLLETNIAAESQYWAVFALTNLTRINPEKYCPMLIPHDGLRKLQELAYPGVTAEFVRKLAQVAIFQYVRYDIDGTLSGLENCDSIDIEVVSKYRGESTQADRTSETGEIIL